MSTFQIIIVVLLVIAGLITLLRFRIRLVLSSGAKTLFIGLGHTGVKTNFTSRTRSVLIAGQTISHRPIKKKVKEKKPKAPLEKPEKKAKKAKRHRPLTQIIAVIPGAIRASLKYAYSLLKAVAIEELEGEINAGFAEPHLTGYAFGFYQSAFAGLPGVAERFKFYPDWTGASFSGRFRFSAAIPLYRIIYRTIVLVFQLPFRELIKLAIGRKRGSQDGSANK